MEEQKAGNLRPGLLNWIEGTNKAGQEVAYVAFYPIEDELFGGIYDDVLRRSGIDVVYSGTWEYADNTRAIYVVKYDAAGEITQDFKRLDKLRLEAVQASMTDGLTTHVLDFGDTSPSIEKTPEMVQRVNEGFVEVFGRNGVYAEVQPLENGLTYVVTASGDLGGDLKVAIQNANVKLALPVLNASAHTENAQVHTEPKLPSESVSVESPRTITSSLTKAAGLFAEVAEKYPKTTGGIMGGLGAVPVALETYAVSKKEIEHGNLPIEGANTLVKGVSEIAGGTAVATPVAIAATPLLTGGPLGAVAYGSVVLGSGYLGAKATGELYDVGRKLMDEGVNYVHAYFHDQKEARQAYETTIAQNAAKNGIPPETAIKHADMVMNGHLAVAASSQIENAIQLESRDR